MYKLYPDTEKELFYNVDYKPLPDLLMLNITQEIELRENLYNALENAFLNGAALLDIALSGDIAKVQKDICINYLLTMSSGHMASIIQSTKYADIDRAIIQAWQYFNYVCTDEEFINIGTDPKEIESIILKAYKA